MKKTIIILSFLFLYLLNSSNTSAVESGNYYRNIFSTWLLETNKKVAKRQEDFMVFTTKEIRNVIELDQYENIILICNSIEISNIEEFLTINCRDLNKKFAERNPYESEVLNEVAESISPIKIGEKKYYVVPEILMITPEYQKMVSNYFKTINNKRLSLYQNHDATTKDYIENLKLLILGMGKSINLLNLFYIIIILIICSIIYNPLHTLINDPKIFLQKSIYIKGKERIKGIYYDNFSLLIFTFFSGVFIYILLTSILFVKGVYTDDPMYATNYILETVKPNKIAEAIVENKTYKLAFIFLNATITTLGLIILIPNLIKILSSSYLKIREIEIDKKYIIWSIPVIILLINSLFGIKGIKSTLDYTLPLLVTLFLLFYYIKQNKIIYTQTVNKKMAMIILVALSLPLIFIKFKVPEEILYKFENAIPEKRGIYTFPIEIQNNENTLLNSFVYKGNSNIYANQYLIFSPDKKTIINRPLSQISKEEANYNLVTSSGNLNVINEILKENDLESIFYTERFSQLILIDARELKDKHSPTVLLEIKYSCKNDNRPTKIIVEITRLDNGDIAKQHIKYSNELAKLPPCETDLPNNLSEYKIPVHANIFSNDRNIINFGTYDQIVIESINFFVDNELVPIKYLDEKILSTNINKILHSQRLNNSSVIVNFANGINDEITFNLDENYPNDISIPINKLIKLGLIPKQFSIWSTDEDEVIIKE